MKIILKVLLFPVTLALFVIVAVCRFVVRFSGAPLSILPFVAFVIAVLAPILLKQPQSALSAGILAFLISPFALPRFAEWLIDKLDGLNLAIRPI